MCSSANGKGSLLQLKHREAQDGGAEVPRGTSLLWLPYKLSKAGWLIKQKYVLLWFWGPETETRVSAGPRSF